MEPDRTFFENFLGTEIEDEKDYTGFVEKDGFIKLLSQRDRAAAEPDPFEKMREDAILATHSSTPAGNLAAAKSIMVRRASNDEIADRLEKRWAMDDATNAAFEFRRESMLEKVAPRDKDKLVDFVRRSIGKGISLSELIEHAATTDPQTAQLLKEIGAELE